MASHLVVTVRYLQSMCHGRADGDATEWPPSPMRVFQALVAAVAATTNERRRIESATHVFQWLEGGGRPDVIAPAAVEGAPYRLSVPNNAMDVVAGAWSRGNYSNSGDANPATHRSMKTVRPTHLVGDDLPAVHFVWPLPPDAPREHLATLQAAARSVTHLGWGVDMAVGHAQELSDDEVATLPGERWRPVERGGVALRVPRAGTFDALVKRHSAFLGRLDGGGFTPVPPLTQFDTVRYRRDSDPEPLDWAAFRILSVNPDDPAPAFETARRCCHVAAWTRHATGHVCGGWPADWPDAEQFVHGHAPTGGQVTGSDTLARFLYLPLPTVEPPERSYRVGAIRRVLVAAPPACRQQVDWVRMRLPGQELLREEDNQSVGLLAPLADEYVLGRYTGASAVWTTVTPVFIRGHDDGKQAKAFKLIRNAFVRAGLPGELIDRSDIEWRGVGYLPGVDLASKFNPPPELNGRWRFHARIRFPVKVSGPLAVGDGRFRGFGTFVGIG